MKRLIGTLAGVALVAGVVGCSLNTSKDVNVTKSEALVAGCQNLGEVSVTANVSDGDTVAGLAQATREKGGNYLLVQGNGARSGSAYRCAAPSASGGR